MAGKVDRPNHSVHIRADLARTATGLRHRAGRRAGGGGRDRGRFQVLDGSSAPGWLLRALWITGSLAVTVSLTGLVLVRLRWLRYLHRRADLDAHPAPDHRVPVSTRATVITVHGVLLLARREPLMKPPESTAVA